MRRVVVIFSAKPYEKRLAESICAGARSFMWKNRMLHAEPMLLDDWKFNPKPNADLLMFTGLHPVRRQLLDRWLETDRPFIHLDKGYSREAAVNVEDYKTEYWRWSLNSFVPGISQLGYFYDLLRSGHIDSRYHLFGWHPGPKKLVGNPDGYYLICPPTPRACAFYGLGGYQQLVRLVVSYLRRYAPNRRLLIRPKPSQAHKYQWALPEPHRVAWDDPRRSLLSSANGAKLVITWTNMVALESWRAGVPCASLGPCGTRSLTESPDILSAINRPPKPKIEERAQLLSGLAWSQFSWQEWRSGLAWHTIVEQLELL